MNKLRLLLVFLAFSSSSFSFAQPTEEDLLKKAKQWVGQNLKCKQYSQEMTTKEFVGTERSLGKCSELDQAVFGNFDSKGLLGLVLEVNGGNWMAPHGSFVEDQKYVFCSYLKGSFSAKVFSERATRSRLESIKFREGADLIWIIDPRPYTEAGSASVYGLVKGEIKNVLTYDYISVCHQCIGGFETALIPLEDRGLKLITLMIDGGAGDGRENYYNSVDGRVLERIYYPDPITDVYQESGTATLPLVKSIVENYEGITSKLSISPEVFDNKAHLEELIVYLKLAKNDAKRKRAHDFLSLLAREDLGENYEVWEKWKKLREAEAESEND